MRNSSGKFVIGLTGNIATGKSVVRRMLEHLGAYTIDADALSHLTYANGAPGFQKVLEVFGKWVLNNDGEVDRKKLGNLVFGDQEAMKQLEQIVHPLVRQATDLLIKRALQPVIVVEAIKLLDGDLRNSCHSIWVTHAPEDVQMERLIRTRGLTREQAVNRIQMQSAQSAKVASADIVINNTGSYHILWKQVSEAWEKIVPDGGEPLADTTEIKRTVSVPLVGEYTVKRGRLRHSPAIAELITRLSKGSQKMTADDIIEEFGNKAYLLLEQNGQLVGLAGWQVENRFTRTSDIFLEEHVDISTALQLIIKEMESASGDLQSEAFLVFTTNRLSQPEGLWKELGYEKRTPETLGVQAWQDAAAESLQTGNGVLFFKQLRRDPVLRPI